MNVSTKSQFQDDKTITIEIPQPFLKANYCFRGSQCALQIAIAYFWIGVIGKSSLGGGGVVPF